MEKEKEMNKCLNCGKEIAQEEFEVSGGLCAKCYRWYELGRSSDEIEALLKDE